MPQTRIHQERNDQSKIQPAISSWIENAKKDHYNFSKLFGNKRRKLLCPDNHHKVNRFYFPWFSAGPGMEIDLNNICLRLNTKRNICEKRSMSKPQNMFWFQNLGQPDGRKDAIHTPWVHAPLPRDRSRHKHWEMPNKNVSDLCLFWTIGCV